MWKTHWSLLKKNQVTTMMRMLSLQTVNHFIWKLLDEKSKYWMKTNIRVIHFHNERRQLPGLEFLPCMSSDIELIVFSLFCLILWASITQEPYRLDTSRFTDWNYFQKLEEVWRMVARIIINQGFLWILETLNKHTHKPMTVLKKERVGS